MKNIKPKLYLTFFNALLISSLATLTACGGSSGSDSGSPVSDTQAGDSSANDGSAGDDTGSSENQNDEIELELGKNDAVSDTKAAASDSFTLSLLEYGDMFTGKPYILKYTVTSSNGSNVASDNFSITAQYGQFSRIHPQTGRTAPSGQIYYYVPESVLGTTDNYYVLGLTT